ncbi:MAG: PAS domain-containing protein, partial [Gemmatimonadales bacterium]
LRPGGFLFLGSSETIGSQRALFEPVDAQHRIYARQPVEPRVAPRLPLGRGTRGTGPGGRPIRQPETGAASAAAALQNETDRILLGRYAPAGVLVNEHLDIVQFRGDTGAWLTPAAGRASFNLLKMLREGLLAPVRSAVTRARKSHEPVRETGLRVGIGDDHRDVDVEVIPVDGGPDSGHCLLVLFEPPARTQPRRGAKGAAARTTRAAEQAEGVRLGKELVATKEYLQSVIDQYEGSHDDLQAANEELQSTNEELQSVNEELETSKEEIQSSSEELATVNEELHTRNAELASSVDDMTNLVSSIQTAIVMLDRRLRIRRFTPAAEKLLNLIGTDVGRPITDIKLNVAVPDLEATAQEVMSKRTRAEFEAQDREGHWYAVRIHPFQLPDGKVDGAVLMLVDIDSLRAAEAAAGKSEERFRLLANTAPVLIWVDDAKGHRFVNRAYRDFVGGDHGEEADAPLWREYIHPDDREPYTATYDDAAGRNAPFEIQIRFRRADGEYRWMKSIAMPRTPDAEFTGYVGAKTDITDLKEAEAQLRSTDRNKNEFIAVLAHELRNPLAPLRNVVQLLQTRGLDSGMSAWAFETLARQIGNITQLVDDLLDVSRITYGKITLRNEPVDIVTAARSAIDMNRAAIGGRQQTLHVDLPETPVMMLADRLRIEQVFGNLLSNASKFTPDGGSIWLSTAVVPAKDAAGAEGRIAEIRVRDNGRGISAEELPGLFNLFTQGEESSRPPVGGLGIGLTVARRLVEMHGGTLTGSSAGRDAGAEFVARLPLPKEEIRSQEPGSRSPAARNHDGRPRRVLVVDDNTDAGDSLTLLLQLHGHEVDVVRTGETAIEMARTWRPDLVLLDINLPDRPGYEIARELREEFEREAMLIAAVTGYSGEIERLRAQESGFDHFFTKPVEIERLLAILEAQE